MKVYICTDIEGVSGVTSFEQQAYAHGRYYEQARKLLTAELNAAVDGLLAAGATDILVLDGHGPGGVSFEDLHPAARIIHGRPLARGAVISEIVRTFDVSMMIGQHAMAGTETGALNHTMNSETVEYHKLNGRTIGEIAQFALYCGALGLPMIFLSGDDVACKEAEDLVAGITTVSVKQGLSRTCAISLAPAEARRRIREAAEQAIARHVGKPLDPLIWPGPFELEKRFFHTETADTYATCPFATRIDARTVRLAGDDILDIIYAYRSCTDHCTVRRPLPL